MHEKIREIRGLNVPKDLVYMIMAKVDPRSLEERGGVGKASRTTFMSRLEYSNSCPAACQNYPLDRCSLLDWYLSVNFTHITVTVTVKHR